MVPTWGICGLNLLRSCVAAALQATSCTFDSVPLARLLIRDDSFQPHRWRLVSALVACIGRTADPAERITCTESPTRRFVPDHDRKADISSRSGTRVWRCLALAHLRFLDDRPATATADTGVFRF